MQIIIIISSSGSCSSGVMKKRVDLHVGFWNGLNVNWYFPSSSGHDLMKSTSILLMFWIAEKKSYWAIKNLLFLISNEHKMSQNLNFYLWRKVCVVYLSETCDIPLNCFLSSLIGDWWLSFCQHDKLLHFVSLVELLQLNCAS